MFLLISLTTLVFLSLAMSNTVQQSKTCYTEAPDNCDFNNGTFCGWTEGRGLTLRGSNVALNDYVSSGSLTSRKACSTGGQTHCLKFGYWFDRPSQPNIGLSVFVRTADQTEVLLWEVRFGPGERSAAQVPIQVDTDFEVVFRWERYDASWYIESTLYVDSIKYEKYSKVLCTLQPPHAIPPSTTTSTTTTKPITFPPTYATEDTTTAAGQNAGRDESKGGNTGAIVGAVIAVVVGLVVVMIAFFIVRRKRLQGSKSKPLAGHRSFDPLTVPPPVSPRNDDVTVSPRNDDVTNTPTYLEILPPSDLTYVNQPSHASHPPSHRQDSQGYELPPPSSGPGQREEWDSGKRSGHDANASVTRDNYDSLDFSQAERDRRVYTSLKKDPEYVVME